MKKWTKENEENKIWKLNLPDSVGRRSRRRRRIEIEKQDKKKMETARTKSDIKGTDVRQLLTSENILERHTSRKYLKPYHSLENGEEWDSLGDIVGRRFKNFIGPRSCWVNLTHQMRESKKAIELKKHELKERYKKELILPFSVITITERAKMCKDNGLKSRRKY